MPKGMSLPVGDIVETVRFGLKSDGEGDYLGGELRFNLYVWEFNLYLCG